MESQSNRPCLDAVWGKRVAVPKTVPVASDAAAPADSVPVNHDT